VIHFNPLAVKFKLQEAKLEFEEIYYYFTPQKLPHVLKFNKT